MCAIFQISGNCLLLTIYLNSSTISFKQNCKTKIKMLPSTEFVPDLHLLNSLSISHCEIKIADKYIPRKLLLRGTFNGSLSILNTGAKNSIKASQTANQSINWYFCMTFSWILLPFHLSI